MFFCKFKTKHLAMKKSVITLFLLACFLGNAQKSVAIYWDASYSMSDRSLDKELIFLNNYFKKNIDVDLNLVVFNNEVVFTKDYSIKEGNWGAVKEKLQSVVYDGSTNFKAIFNKPHDEYLLFTDGVENFNELEPPTTKPIYIISSSPNSNSIDLKLIADLSGGAYMLLGDHLLKRRVTEKVDQVSTNENHGKVSGIIKGKEGVLIGVNVFNQSQNIGIASENDGTYKIDADLNDILVYSYLGKKTVRIRVFNVDTINVLMQNIDQTLEEVVVTGERDEVTLVNTGNRKENADRIGYSIESIGEKDISPIDTNVKQAVKGQFSNLLIQNSTTVDRVDLSQFIGRGKNMTINGNQYGLIVVDGVPLEPSDSSTGNREIPYFDVTKKRISSTDHLDPNLIVDVTYLKGLAATNKYGSMGRNGVLLITTKMGINDDPIVKKSTKLGTTSVYSGQAESIKDLPANAYINDISNASNVYEAYDKYLKNRELYGEDPVFYLDVAEFFTLKQHSELANRVLSNIYEIAFDDAMALRLLSYKQHNLGDFEGAVKTLERILELQPDHAQSYRDLGLGYVYANKTEEAFNFYNRILKGIGVKANLSSINKAITTDYKNFITLNKQHLNLSDVESKYLRPLNYKTRIVFEWNDLNSEFDLNIINPDKRFFTWSHTNAENSVRIDEQKQYGYGLEEFYLTNNDVGTWTFNMEYFGNTASDDYPLFIKITVYQNYGLPNQTKEIKVVRLQDQNIEQTVATVSVR